MTTGVIGMTFAVVAASLVARVQEIGFSQLPLRLGGLSFLAAGMIAWVRLPRTRVGPLLVFVGLSWHAGDLRSSSHQVVFAVGFCLAFLPAAVVGHVALSFPSGRLSGWRDRGVMIGVYLIAVGTQVCRYFADSPRPPWSWTTNTPNTLWARIGSADSPTSTVAAPSKTSSRSRPASTFQISAGDCRSG